MAKITSKALLNVGTELTVNVSTRTITLNVAGNLVAKEGVSWRALYSKMISLWTGAAYNEHPFPFYTIDALSGQFNIGFDGTRYNNWKFETNSKLYLRDGGWNHYEPLTPGADGTSATSTGVGGTGPAATYAGIVSLGDVSTNAQLYYQLTDGGSASNFTYVDEANQGIQVFGDATHGSITNANYFKAYCREYAKKYAESILADTGKTETGAYIVNMLLANSDDLDIVNTDTDVITVPISPYDKMRINYFASPFTKDINEVGSQRPFGIVIDVGTHSGVDGSMGAGGSVLTTAIGGINVSGNPFAGGTLTVHEGTNKGTYTISGNPTATTVTITGTFAAAESNSSFTIQRLVPVVASLKQIYTFVQAKLRQSGNINNVNGGVSVTGKTASLLMNWTAKLLCGFNTLIVNPAGGGEGVLVEGLSDADVNTIVFYDNAYTTAEYPFISAGTLVFNSNLTSGGTGYYVLYYTDLSALNDYGTVDAVIVKNASGADISGTITSGTISITYAFGTETAGGLRTPGSNTAVTLVAGNPGVAKPVVATGTLTESKTISISAVAEQDRAYQA